MTRPVTILGLDVGTEAGWFLRLPDGSRQHGAWKFPSGQPMGNRILKLYQSIVAVLKEYDCMEHDVRIAVEATMFTQNPGSQVLGNKMVGNVEFLASVYGFAPPVNVNVGSWRAKFLTANDFLEKSKAPASVKDKTAWYKAKVIEQCQRMGMDPQTHDEADAIGVGYWYWKGGLEEQKKRKAEEKRKKALKKVQMKMDV